MSRRNRRKGNMAESNFPPQRKAAIALPTAAPIAAQSAAARPENVRPAASLIYDPGRDLATWIVCGFLFIVALGYFLLTRDGIAIRGNEFSRDIAFFQAVNAATLTGFPTRVSYSESLAGPTIIFSLMMVGSIMTLSVGGLAAERLLKLGYNDRQVFLASVGVTVGATLLGGSILWIDGRSDSGSLPGFFNACFLALSAFSNTGLDAGMAPAVTSWQTQFVLMPMALLGGFGLPVLLNLWDTLCRRATLNMHTQMVVALTAGVYVVVAVVLCALSLSAGRIHTVDGPSIWPNLAFSSASSINTRTAGFAFNLATVWPRAMRWIVALLMIVGAAPAGTAGGLKVTTLWTLWRGVRRTLRGEAPGRSFGIAAAWTGLYCAIVLLIFFLLLTSQMQLGPDRLMFEAISAVSNVGLAYDTILVVGVGAFYLSAAMLFGRLAPLMIIWWAANSTDDAEVVVG